MFAITVDLTSAELEEKYKHLHHCQALYLLERARLTLLEKIGFSTDTLIMSGLFPVISSISVRYLREIREGKFTVTCEDIAINGRAINIKQRIINMHGKCCVEATVQSMLLHGALKRAVEPSEGFAKAILGACV